MCTKKRDILIVPIMVEYGVSQFTKFKWLGSVRVIIDHTVQSFKSV